MRKGLNVLAMILLIGCSTTRNNVAMPDIQYDKAIEGKVYFDLWIAAEKELDYVEKELKECYDKGDDLLNDR